jgi:hypothetical protein
MPPSVREIILRAFGEHVSVTPVLSDELVDTFHVVSVVPRYTFAVPAADYERATNGRGSLSVFINELKTRREVAMGMV